jgi:glyoxylase-like metal-dependent hydrolase (beta-lactamase superfamily II)
MAGHRWRAVTRHPGPRFDLTVTRGPHVVAGCTIELENNAWTLGDDGECLVVDAPHDADAVVAAAAGRRVVAVACTHAHGDHVGRAPEVGRRLAAPVLLHPADLPVWRRVHDDAEPDGPLADRQVLDVAGIEVEVLHTPGHTPGSVCLSVPALGAVLSGDTLFPGGPGATRPPFGDFAAIIASVRDRLFTLPPGTRVLPGHGPTTTVGAEAPHLPEWIARGW